MNFPSQLVETELIHFRSQRVDRGLPAATASRRLPIRIRDAVLQPLEDRTDDMFQHQKRE